MLKGVEAVAIHGSKSTSLPLLAPPRLISRFAPSPSALTLALVFQTAQEEREYAIKAFKSGKKDVMVASSVASKGLDFSEIQHVINYSMPKEIEVSSPMSPLSFVPGSCTLGRDGGLVPDSGFSPRALREHVLTWVGII